MDKSEATEARIDALEMQLAHQGRMIEDLNSTITDQWKQIETLTRQVKRLDEQIQETRDNAGSPGEQEPPPHY